MSGLFDLRGTDAGIGSPREPHESVARSLFDSEDLALFDHLAAQCSAEDHAAARELAGRERAR